MKKFILAIVQGIVTSIVKAFLLVTPPRTLIHVFERFIVTLHANRRFRRVLADYIVEKMCHNLNPGEETPEVPELVKLYNAFVLAHDTFSLAAPPRPNEKRRAFRKIHTL